MNLTIDIGNTAVKAAVFNNDKLLCTEMHKQVTVSLARKWLAEFKISNAIVSNVSSNAFLVKKILGSTIHVVELNKKTRLPFTNSYKTPETLGPDRVAAIAGALTHFSKGNILVVDTGTCIKYNFINSKKEFLGGGISPGIAMRFRAMHEFTGKLPNLVPTIIEGLVGTDTNSSMQNATLLGTLFEVSEMIQAYRKNYPRLKVILTGGDHPFFVRNLKMRTFACPELLAEGLNHILVYNTR